MAKKTEPTSIRLPKEMIERIKAEAEKEKRSVTAQIEYIIEKYWEIKKTL